MASSTAKHERREVPQIKQASDDDLRVAASPGTAAATATVRGSRPTVAKGPTNILGDVEKKETPRSKKFMKSPKDKSEAYSQDPQDSSQEAVRPCTEPFVSRTLTNSPALTTAPRKELSEPEALGQSSTIDDAPRSALQARDGPAVLSTARSTSTRGQARGGSAGGVSDGLVGEFARREYCGYRPTEPDKPRGFSVPTSPTSLPCGQGYRDVYGLHKLESARHSISLPIVESPDRMPQKAESARRSTSLPITESPDRRNVRFEQQRAIDSGHRKKSRRQRTVFPCLYPGSRSGSGSGFTSSTSTRDSPLRVCRQVAFAPRFLNKSRVKVLCRAVPVVVILSALVLSAALIASLLLGAWRLEAVAVCRSKPCREYARLLADSVNTSLNPCADFTGFVCSGWRRHSQQSVQEEWMLFELSRLSQLLRSVYVPPEHQNALQKSAAFLRSCEAVRNGDLDEMPKVKPALLEAGIVWPLLSKDSDVLHTWLYTSLRLHWSTVLHVSIERYPNITVIFLEPLREFHRLAEKHEQWASDMEQAERYFETLRQEFHSVTESAANETEDIVNFATTHHVDVMYLPPLQHNSGFLSNYSVLDPAMIFETVPAFNHERWQAELYRNGAGISGDVIFVSTKPGFVRVFLDLWKYRGDGEMHLFLSWCTVQTVALYTNRRLLVNFYGRGDAASSTMGLPTTKTSYKDSFDLLEKRFGDRTRLELEYFSRWRQPAFVMSGCQDGRLPVRWTCNYCAQHICKQVSESSANKYHAALCLSKANLLCGSDLFGKYFQDVISEQVMRVAQRVVVDTRQAFASRLERSWPYKDDNISVVEDWQSTNLALGYFDPSTHEERQQQIPGATCTRDLGDSLVVNLLLASLGHVNERHRWASEQIELAEWYVLKPGNDLALLPYAITFPWISEGGTRFMNHGGLGSHVAGALSLLFFSSYVRVPDARDAIIRAIESANKASRPRDVGDRDRAMQVFRALALDVSYDAYRAAGAVEGDEHLEGFEGYGGAAMFFIASCYALCRGSDTPLPFAGAECDEPFRNIEGFGNAFGCELGSAMNPFNKTTLM